MKKEQLLNLLRQLESREKVPFSEVPKSVLEEFKTFGEQKGCFSVEKIGRGRNFKTSNRSILQNEINRLTPDVDLDSASYRAKNLAINNDTKVGQTTLQFSHFHCKSVGEQICIENNGLIQDVSAVTKCLGGFNISIEDNSDGIKCHSNLILVENQQLLDDISWVPKGWNGILLYYGGNIHGRLLNWLKKSSFNGIIIFPDYDSVGISNFSRIKKEIPSVQWFWIDNWEHLLKKYGKADLWNEPKQFSTFNNLWKSFEEHEFPDSKLKQLMIKMRLLGKGLEQEIALLKATENAQS
ncbi:MAG: hypothetical protein J5977_09665 [Fibrobacter sp.]|nr:hypothetical protein [Fibrobacter sp.]